MDKGSILSNEVLQMVTGQTQISYESGYPEPANAEYFYSKFPNEFEYYALAMELVNSKGETVLYFGFPILPDNIHLDGKPLSNIRRTMTGQVVLNNPVYPNADIKITGDFGRKFKRVVRFDDTTTTVQRTNSVGEADTGIVEFDREWKSGYGCTKLVEQMMKMVNQVDDVGGVYRMFFYCLPFNMSVLVEPTDSGFSMSKDKNRIWNYDLSFRVLGNASDFNAHYLTKKQTIAIDGLMRDGNVTAKTGNDALMQQPLAKSNGFKTNLQKLVDSEVGKRVYQVGVSYMPNALRTALQLAESNESALQEGPDKFLSFSYNTGNNILNTGKIL